MGHLILSGRQIFLTSTSLMILTSVEWVVTVMRLVTLSKCRLKCQVVVVITTVMLTIWVDVAQALGTLEDIALAEDAPLTVTRSSGSRITRTMTLQTLTWSRMDRESTSTFVIRAGTGVLWATITVTWSFQCHFGVGL